jgi:2-keto-4-pentenoate hydratase/2-oxohepta-3-ene-1,7-dioic acid hydratase in catechol pathway
LNYAAHAAEQGSKLPEQPIIFTMQPGAAANPGDDVVCPAIVLRLDYEGELAIVMGGGGAIAGYCVADDVSARDLQHREKQWTRAKGFDGAVPFGPWVTTVDEVPDPCSLRLRTWVNDELRQDTNTADMIFRPQQVVDFIAEACTLRPGDVIVTGTPSGVGMSMDPLRSRAWARSLTASLNRISVPLVPGTSYTMHTVFIPRRRDGRPTLRRDGARRIFDRSGDTWARGQANRSAVTVRVIGATT